MQCSWAPHVAFQTEARLVALLLGGRWHNRCKLSDVTGNTEYEAVCSLRNKGPVPADQLKIDPEKIGQQGVDRKRTRSAGFSSKWKGSHTGKQIRKVRVC